MKSIAFSHERSYSGDCFVGRTDNAFRVAQLGTWSTCNRAKRSRPAIATTSFGELPFKGHRSLHTDQGRQQGPPNKEALQRLSGPLAFLLKPLAL